MPADDKHLDADHPEDGSAMAKSSCTDILCLLIWVAFMGGMGYVGAYGYKNGTPANLTHGYNYNGKLCGVDSPFEDAPFLYYCPAAYNPIPINGAYVPIELNTKAAICLKKCPTDFNETTECLSPSQVAATTNINGTQVVSMVQGTENKTTYPTKAILGLYCVPDAKVMYAALKNGGVPVDSLVNSLAGSLTNSTGPIGNYGAKAMNAVGGLKDCWMLLIGTAVGAVILGYTYLFLLRICAKPLIYILMLVVILLCGTTSMYFLAGEILPENGNSVSTPWGNFTVDPNAIQSHILNATEAAKTALADANTAIQAHASTAADLIQNSNISSHLNNLASSASAAASTAASHLNNLTSSAQSALSNISLNPRRLLEDPFLENPFLEEDAADARRLKEYNGTLGWWKDHNPFYSEHLDDEQAKQASLVVGIFFGVLTLLFIIIVCCCHSTINTAIGCVQAAVECMFDMPTLLIMPLVEVAVKSTIFAILMVFFVYLVSCGELDQKHDITVGGQTVGGIRRSFKWTEEQKIYIAYYVFGIFWMMELANSIGQFVISYAVVLWYYTVKPKRGGPMCGIFRGYMVACTFHLGTLAFGSFLIAVLRYVRLICLIIEKNAEADGNAVAKCIARAVGCCLECFKKFVKYINKNAYIDVCITSKNFCGAAKDVMEFFAGHGVEVLLMEGACTVFVFAGMVIIPGLNAYITYTLAKSVPRWADENSEHYVQSPEFVAGIAAVFALFITYSFMVIFDHTADTLLYTFCWNKSHAHNTVAKYAPSVLIGNMKYEPLVAKKEPAKKDAGHGGFWSTLFHSHHSEETEPLVKK